MWLGGLKRAIAAGGLPSFSSSILPPPFPGRSGESSHCSRMQANHCNACARPQRARAALLCLGVPPAHRTCHDAKLFSRQPCRRAPARPVWAAHRNDCYSLWAPANADGLPPLFAAPRSLWSPVPTLAHRANDPLLGFNDIFTLIASQMRFPGLHRRRRTLIVVAAPAPSTASLRFRLTPAWCYCVTFSRSHPSDRPPGCSSRPRLRLLPPRLSLARRAPTTTTQMCRMHFLDMI